MRGMSAVLAILGVVAGLLRPESVYAQRAHTTYDYNKSQIAPVFLDSDTLLAILNQTPADAARVILNAYGQQTCTVNSADGLPQCASLAPVKVVQGGTDPNCPYLGVFHNLVTDPFFATYAACSLNLSTWKTRGAIDNVLNHEYGSQPDIRILSDDSVLFAEEYNNQTNTKPRIRVRYYGKKGSQTGLQAFIANPGIAPTNQIILPNINSTSFADGTPEFGRIDYQSSIQNSKIEVNNHYFYLGQRDLQAVGTLNNFTNWTDASDTVMNQLITGAGGNGKIGDHEVFKIGSTVYEIVEAQVNPTSADDFGSWRLFLVDKTQNLARQISPRLGGALSIGNPTITFVTYQGAPALLFTCFVFSENSNGTPPGGHMYVYRLN